MKKKNTPRGFTQQVSLLHLREKVAGGRMRGNLAAFTLIELLIAVLIIGILAAVAIPMYKPAMIKSRFSTVMPVAKTIADAQESYYLRNGQYASDKEALDVTPPNVENTTVALSGAEENADENYAYVVASRSDVPGAHYIMYQKYSENYPSEIHCEAEDNNDDAQWLCGALSNNNSIGQTITSGYTTYIIDGTGAGVVPSAGDNSEEPAEPETPTCDGEAPTKEESCPSGCGKVTVTATCEEGAWVYPTADTSSCPTKPNDETAACDTGYTGNKTRSATCNSAGTAWEFTDNWNTSGCTAVPTCTGTPAATVTTSGSGATGTNPTCVNGRWTYTWTGGKTYGEFDFCAGNKEYQCAGAIFSGNESSCFVLAANGCAGSIFSGRTSFCEGAFANQCANTIINGDYSYCLGATSNGCAGAEIQAGASCWAESDGGCDGTLYGAHPGKNPNLIGSCFEHGASCPTGVPLRGSWNSTTNSYDISGWKGNCCNPAYMVSGTCPSGIAVCQ